MPSASDFFDFLNCQGEISWRRHEVSSVPFSALRRALRDVVIRFAEADDAVAREISDRFRCRLSEWLTVPVPFDSQIVEILHSLWDSEAIQARWGADIRKLHDMALAAARAMTLEESPLRCHLGKVLRQLRTDAKSFKIYCHRSAVPHFESILSPDEPLGVGAFLHTVRDYRESGTFDVLIKVGPLRARGWGSVPDAILSAPRFSTLIQFVWSGCSDEPGFGYDPVSPPSLDDAQQEPNASATSLSHRVPWNFQSIKLRANTESGESSAALDEDDFVILSPLTRNYSGRRRATLLQVDDAHGILYPVSARVISFNPALQGPDSVDFRLPGESLVEGLYIVSPLLPDVDSGGVRVEHGRYSSEWKARLRSKFQEDPVGLKARLRAAGLKNLVHLDAAIKHWCAEPTTVIHAPQQMRHFEILASVLGFGEGAAGLSWWQIAWNEIRHSRGEAIQAGVQEQEKIDEQTKVLLRKLLPQLQQKALGGSGFHLQIPSGHDMTGAFLFYKVSAVEEGFLAPESELKVIRELGSLEQWRV